jgi:hypothetical protein
MHLLSKPYEGQNDYEREHIGVRCTLGPKDVREAIEFALESGWDPTDKKQQGCPFRPKGPIDLGEYRLS